MATPADAQIGTPAQTQRADGAVLGHGVEHYGPGHVVVVLKRVGEQSPHGRGTAWRCPWLAGPGHDLGDAAGALGWIHSGQQAGVAQPPMLQAGGGAAHFWGQLGRSQRGHRDRPVRRIREHMPQLASIGREVGGVVGVLAIGGGVALDRRQGGPQPIEHDHHLAVQATQPGGPEPVVEHQQTDTTDGVWRDVEQRVVRRGDQVRPPGWLFLRLVAAGCVERADMGDSVARDLAGGLLNNLLDLDGICGWRGVAAHQDLGVPGSGVRCTAPPPDHGVETEFSEGPALFVGQVEPCHADGNLAPAERAGADQFDNRALGGGGLAQPDHYRQRQARWWWTPPSCGASPRPRSSRW
ncbi:MAG: hypothetical protein J0H91_05135 [Rhodospirillales bacterium]|nr:hypothetical protein [Rhodospirillales bacterium]